MASTAKQTKKSTTNRRNSVGGFYVDKINGEKMRAFVAAKGLDIDVDVSDEQLGVALAMHFKDTTPADDQVRCDSCDAISSADEESCPFCGDEGEVESAEESGVVAKSEDVSTPAVDEESTPDLEVASDDADDVEEINAHAVPAEEPSAPAVEESTEITNPQSVLDADTNNVVSIDSAKKTKKKNAKEPETMQTTTHVNGKNKTNGASKKSTSTALATTSTALATTSKKSTALVSSSDLDTAVANVIALKSEGAANYWKLGRALLDINAKQLWKLRVDDKGKSKFKSFDAFVNEELKMSPQHAYAAIDVAKEYESADEVRALGQTKAALILRAAPEDRPALQEAAKNGASVREISEKVKESRSTKGAPKKTKQAQAGAKGGKQKAATTAARSEKITVAQIEGVKTVKLYKRPESLRGLDFDTLKRAKTIADQPFGRVELTNGVVMFVSVIAKDGELIAKCEFRRETT